MEYLISRINWKMMELFAAEDVEMHMLYALTAVLTAVIYNTVTVCKSE